MTVVLTGANGFLGWHVRVLMHALGMPVPIVLQRNDFEDPARMATLMRGADRLVHLAGVNRGDPQDNVTLAAQLAHALELCATPPKTVVFANSIQAGNGTAYGQAKALAAQRLAQAAPAFADVRLPNVFGEHGRPHYNSVVATFCRTLVDGGKPSILADRSLDLLHANAAAAWLLGVDTEPRPVSLSVSELAARLHGFAQAYRRGEIPDLSTDFAVRLFNTYRSHCAPAALPLSRHADSRGELVDTVKARGGGGQCFHSVTAPGVTRGQHFHLSKVERFVVMRGEAEIRLRRLFHEEVLRFRVSGREPVAIDMPTMWAHDITNVGDDELLTMFWASEPFDPQRPDTYPEAVV